MEQRETITITCMPLSIRRFACIIALLLLPVSASARIYQKPTAPEKLEKLNATTLKGRYEGDFLWNYEHEEVTSHHTMIIKTVSQSSAGTITFGGIMDYNNVDGAHDRTAVTGKIDALHNVLVKELSPPEGAEFTTGR